MLDTEMETAFDRYRGFMRAVLAKAAILTSWHSRDLIKHRLNTRFCRGKN